MDKARQVRKWFRSVFDVECKEAKGESKICLCHNDLNNLNVLIRQAEGNETQCILIDF